MELKLYQIDAFASRPFSGNPAAVIALDAWLPDAVLQAIAEENNLSETAYFVANGDAYHIRWFTPLCEVDLCGHATLAAAYVVFHRFAYANDTLRFDSKSGPLSVTRKQAWLEMDFPADMPALLDSREREQLAAVLGALPCELLGAQDYLAVYESEQAVAEFVPDFEKLKPLGRRGLILTAPGDSTDFVSRFFAPNFGIDEDPVTGSAHCQLVPYWAARMRKNDFEAKQLSTRGGELRCRFAGDRVRIAGQACQYLEGRVVIPD